MQDMDFIGFGALNLDRIIPIDKIPKIDEESFVHGNIKYYPGGSAANTIVGLSRLGCKTAYIGKIGSDKEGKFILKDLKKEGVDLRNVKIVRGRTGIANIFLDPKGNKVIIVDPGVNDFIGINDIDINFVRRFKFLHLTSFVGDLSFKTQKRLVNKLNSEVKISFAPGLYIRRGLRALEGIVKSSTMMFLSKDEVELLTHQNYMQASETLLDMGVKVIAITLGKLGCWVANSHEKCFVHVKKVMVKDTTGAGDAFNAGFLYGLIKGKKIKECARLGNKLASCCIKKIGARNGLPYEANLKDCEVMI